MLIGKSSKGPTPYIHLNLRVELVKFKPGDYVVKKYDMNRVPFEVDYDFQDFSIDEKSGVGTIYRYYKLKEDDNTLYISSDLIFWENKMKFYDGKRMGTEV